MGYWLMGCRGWIVELKIDELVTYLGMSNTQYPVPSSHYYYGQKRIYNKKACKGTGF